MKLFKPAYERDPRWQLSNWRALHQDRSRHYVAVQALREMRDRIGEEAVAQLKAILPGPARDAYNVDHMCGEIIDRIRRFDLGKDLAAIGELIRLSENAEYRETAKQIEPPLKAVAELDAKVEAERIARQRAEADLSLAREAAKARALENVDNDAAVISAQERLREVQSLSES
jgi:hypothetical protein